MMNNSKALVILCNDTYLFYEFCKFFPKKFADDYDFYVVFDNRLEDISDKLQLIIDSTDNKYIKSFQIINGDIILNHFESQFKYCKQNKFSLTTLKNLYFLEKYDAIFSSDDDVIIFRYNSRIFNNQVSVIQSNGNVGEAYFNEDLYKLMTKKGYDIDKVLYSKTRATAGNYFLHKEMYQPLMDINKIFYNDEEIFSLLKNVTRLSYPNLFTMDAYILRLAMMQRKARYVYKELSTIIGTAILKKRNIQISKQSVMFHISGRNKLPRYQLIEQFCNKHFQQNVINVKVESTDFRKQYSVK